MRRFPTALADFGRTWWPLALPLLAGLLSVWFAVSNVAAAQGDGSRLEGALFGLAILGWLTSAVCFAWALLVAASIVAARRRSFVEYVAILFVATIPVAFYQGINYQSSVMGLLWGLMYQPNGGNVFRVMLLADFLTYLLLFGIVSTIAYVVAYKRGSAS